MPRIATREVGVALHIGADDGNERLPFQSGEDPCWGLAGFDAKLLMDVGNDLVADQMILMAASDTTVGSGPFFQTDCLSRGIAPRGAELVNSLPFLASQSMIRSARL